MTTSQLGIFYGSHSLWASCLRRHRRLLLQGEYHHEAGERQVSAIAPFEAMGAAAGPAQEIMKTIFVDNRRQRHRRCSSTIRNFGTRGHFKHTARLTWSNGLGKYKNIGLTRHIVSGSFISTLSNVCLQRIWQARARSGRMTLQPYSCLRISGTWQF